MSPSDRPHPAAVPTLTEVIELLSPVSSAPVTPIVTPGLPPLQPTPGWTPMSTVVVPTLSEVAVPPVDRELSILKQEVGVTIETPAVSGPAVSSLPEVNEAQLTQRIMQVIQKQVDGMIEFRLKEAMAPILARHSEAMSRELREELSRTMADVVARSVAQEMAKLRVR
jgi:hypothetical protein